MHSLSRTSYKILYIPPVLRKMTQMMRHPALLSIRLTLNTIVLGRTAFEASKKFEVPTLSLKKAE